MTPELEYSLIQEGLGFQHPDIRELCIWRPFHGEWENLIAVALNLRLPPMYPNVDTIVDPVSGGQSCARRQKIQHPIRFKGLLKQPGHGRPSPGIWCSWTAGRGGMCLNLGVGWALLIYLDG